MKVLDTRELEKRLNLIESYIIHSQVENTSVSKANVAWHLDHSLKVINEVAKNMQNSDASLYVDNFSFVGKVLLKLNFFPKGKAKAPKYVLPPKIILNEDIITQLQKAKNNLKEIIALDENTFFKHPLFGNISKKRVLSFLKTHTDHHLKIVKNILK